MLMYFDADHLNLSHQRYLRHLDFHFSCSANRATNPLRVTYSNHRHYLYTSPCCECRDQRRMWGVFLFPRKPVSRRGRPRILNPASYTRCCAMWSLTTTTCCIRGRPFCVQSTENSKHRFPYAVFRDAVFDRREVLHASFGI